MFWTVVEVRNIENTEMRLNLVSIIHSCFVGDRISLDSSLDSSGYLGSCAFPTSGSTSASGTIKHLVRRVTGFQGSNPWEMIREPLQLKTVILLWQFWQFWRRLGVSPFALCFHNHWEALNAVGIISLLLFLKGINMCCQDFRFCFWQSIFMDRGREF